MPSSMMRLEISERDNMPRIIVGPPDPPQSLSSQ
jgi:hypothetical protein